MPLLPGAVLAPAATAANTKHEEFPGDDVCDAEYFGVGDAEEELVVEGGGGER